MKRYVAKWRGKKIILTEEDYKILLERFDIKNFELIEGLFINEVTCPLCVKYLNKYCSGCTFNKFYHRGSLGCLKILDQISEEIKTEQHLNLLFDTVSFSLKRKDEALKLIDHINGLLLTEFKLAGGKK